MLVDHWAWRYAEDPKGAEEDYVDDEFDAAAEVARLDAESVDDWEPI